MFFNYDSICPVCQKKSLSGFTHPLCVKRYTPNSLVTPYLYSGVVRDVFLNSKYYKKEFSLIYSLVDYLSDFLEQFNLVNLDEYTLTFVPGDPERMKKKGFILSKEICNSLSRLLGIKRDSLLKKTVSTPPLYQLKKLQRKEVVKSKYIYVGKEIPKKVILVDDIFTTGATMLENTRILKRSGVKSVICFALAYRPLKNS